MYQFFNAPNLLNQVISFPAAIIAFPLAIASAIALALAPIVAGIYLMIHLVKGVPDPSTIVSALRTVALVSLAIFVSFYFVLVLYKAEYDVYFTLVETSRHVL
jgi:hypothetical protein